MQYEYFMIASILMATQVELLQNVYISMLHISK